ncbi:hypothetical protein [Phormidium sp. CCY1219]|uniref:hypothetical protein n=1 Tax=Phormidium sp. CCY1219 TaxID=2886104 RepID=UPI002D1F7A2E|nr:hypothetical protein [Phormidium sp. CCY1219]MEB3829405.1 hypothetical protein [Phormidium sp. CCY1219]
MHSFWPEYCELPIHNISANILGGEPVERHRSDADGRNSLTFAIPSPIVEDKEGKALFYRGWRSPSPLFKEVLPEHFLQETVKA